VQQQKKSFNGIDEMEKNLINSQFGETHEPAESSIAETGAALESQQPNQERDSVRDVNEDGDEEEQQQEQNSFETFGNPGSNNVSTGRVVVFNLEFDEFDNEVAMISKTIEENTTTTVIDTPLEKKEKPEEKKLVNLIEPEDYFKKESQMSPFN
jgi:hypothetical protein